MRARPTAVLIEAGLVAGPEMLSFLRSAREAGVRVVLATDGGSDLDPGDFDAVADAAVIGSHKPQRDFFVAACALIDTPPEQCLLIDDADRNVRGARVAGLSALRFSGPADLSYARAALSLP